MWYILAMKKISFFVFLSLVPLLLTGCLPNKQKAALQIVTKPAASVFINGKLVGKTPYTDRELSSGEVTLKLIPESTAISLSSWEGKLKLVGGVMSVVSREFAESEENASGDILTLEPSNDKKNASLAVVTTPDGAAVKIDGENRGFSPLVLDQITEGEHQITLSLNDYRENTLKAKAINGYKLILNSKLAKEVGGQNPLSSGTPTPEPTGKTKLTTTPTPKISITPTSKVSPSPRPTVAITGASIEVKETPTGWLRVREEPSSSSKELTKIYPGEKYPFLEEKNGWYKITYAEGKTGWISGQYAEKVE